MRKSGTITTAGRGKTFERSLAAAQKKVRDSDLYFINRGGAWFRPEAHGYTGDLAAAGTFAGAHAKGYLQAEGVALVPVREMMPKLVKQMRDHVEAAQRLNSIIQQFD